MLQFLGPAAAAIILDYSLLFAAVEIRIFSRKPRSSLHYMTSINTVCSSAISDITHYGNFAIKNAVHLLRM